MKKTNNTFYFIAVLFSVITLNLHAQLSGTYSINAGAPVSASNYTSFTAFASDFNALGVSGPVIVVVVPNSGPYIEQVNFNMPIGVSATNSVLIQGNGNTLSFNATNSAAPWTLLYSGADYMTVSNLTVVAQNASNGFALKLWNQASFNNFINCTFSCQINTTGTAVMPVSLSATNNSWSSTGTAALNQYNTWNGCTMVGGYNGISIYGSTTLPYTLGNNVINCNIRDFYLYGIYNYYHYAFTNNGCILDRPNLTSLTTYYGIYTSGVAAPSGGTVTIENNRIRNPYTSNTSITSTMYGIFIAQPGSAGNKVIVRNNVISDIKSNGGIYPIYAYVNFCDVVHNTISMDDINSTATSVAYGIYYYGTGGIVKNNLITISRGGSGTKVGLFYASTMGTGTVTSNGNHVYMAPNVNNAFYGYHFNFGGNIQSYATWTTSTSMDFLGGNIMPGFINPSQENYLPTSYALNDRGEPIGVANDILGNTRNSSTPDPGAKEFLNTPCSGFPATNAILTPTFVQCPGTNLSLNFANSYTTNGLTFQWQSSTTSSVGPFSAIANGTTQSISTGSIGQTTWYNAIITCTNGNFSTNALAGGVQIAGTTTNSIPYFENFDQIALNNRLPNCSWFSPSLGSTALTYTSPNSNNRVPRSGNGFASFFFNPGGVKDYFTNGVQLQAGITYSASLWFITESFANWSNLSILVGPNQSTSSQTLIANTNGPAVSPFYTSLSGTFSVATSGLYYFNIEATSNTGSNGQYLSWDDFSVIIPCTHANNAPNLTLNASANSICSGDQLFLSMSGANTYTWSTGVNTATMVDYPTSNTTYTGIGRNTLSGCTATVSHQVVVKQSPNLVVFGFPNTVCAGQSANIQATGANTYAWNNSATTSNIKVSPLSSTGYSVIGTGLNGCSAIQSIFITVLNNPTVQAFTSEPQICIGETATLTGIGASNYQWTAPSLFVNTNNAVVLGSILGTTTYTLIGTDINGCVGTATVNLKVNACTSIAENNLNNIEFSIYPNPSTGEINIVSGNNTIDKIEVLDVTGKVIKESTSNSHSTKLDLSDLSNGVYYIKASGVNQNQITKLIKQ